MTKTSDLTLELDGLSCASCVGRAERALSAVPGVSAATVNLATGTARVAAPSASTTEIAAALGKAGYPARSERVVLEIERMSCASCVRRVEQTLAAVPGVVSASVNLAAGRADLDVLRGSDAALRAATAATDAGYPARLVTADAPQEDRTAAEAERLRRQTLLAALLTLPVFVLEMGGHVFPAFHHWIAATIGMQTSHVLQFVLTTSVLAGPGRLFFMRGIPALLKATPDMNSLVALGTLAAWGFSSVATFTPALLPEGTAAVYFEAAAVIVTLILLGRLLEARAKGRTGAAIARLAGLSPRTARIEREGSVSEVALAEVRAGDIVHVRPGERLPVDGIVLRGESYVDESMITGEPVPVPKAADAELTGGTVNGTGALVYRATRVGADTVLAQIVRMVEQAQGARLPIQDLVNRVTAWFVPAVLAVAVLTVALWLVFAPVPALGHALVAGVAVLIIACPCAMGLATPTSIMVGTGRAADLGVLFRQGDALQRLASVGIVAFDKTGTLTEGRPDLTAIAVAEGFDEDSVLALAAAAERPSEHPVGQAILRAAERRGLPLPEAEAFASITGHGITAIVDGRAVLVGSARLLEREGIDLGALADTVAGFAAKGQTALFAAIDGCVAAALGVSDPVRPESRAAVAALRARGLDVAMITGDGRATAEAIAAEIGITRVEAEVLPEGKLRAVDALRAEGRPVAFVGDGINDAPALAAADVGIAIGTGTDVAIESADVVLMSGDPHGVVRALTISTATLRNIRQNLVWAFGYNVLLIPVAAGALYPATGLLLSPALAAGAMALSSVFVLTNALRLRAVAAPAGDPRAEAARQDLPRSAPARERAA